jgi:hypothetical protein
MAKTYKSHITFDELNIKCKEHLDIFIECLDYIEKKCCVWTTKITIKNSFICPDIKEPLHKTEMEKIVWQIIIKKT